MGMYGDPLILCKHCEDIFYNINLYNRVRLVRTIQITHSNTWQGLINQHSQLTPYNNPVYLCRWLRTIVLSNPINNLPLL